MTQFVRYLSSVGPFILGLVFGALLFFSITTWGVELDEIVKWLAITAVVVLVVSILLWLVYRLSINKVSAGVSKRLPKILREIEDNPLALSDQDFKARVLWPLLPDMVRGAIAWLGFTNAVAISIALVANLVLLATLAVQYLSAERLEGQNILLAKQNDLLTDQSKLLEAQSLAAVAEQVLALDAAISEILHHQDEVGRILGVVSSSEPRKVTHEPGDFSLNMSISDLNPCIIFEDRVGCEQAIIWQIANDFDDFQDGEIIEFEQEFYPAFQLLVNFLEYRNSRFRKMTDSLRQVRDEPSRDEVAYSQEAVRRFGATCQVEPTIVRETSVQLSLVRLLESSTWAYGPQKLTSDWSESAEEFPQIRSNTSMAHLNFTSGFSELSEYFERTNYDRDKYTTLQFSIDLSQLYHDLIESLESIASKCASESDRLRNVRESLQM